MTGMADKFTKYVVICIQTISIEEPLFSTFVQRTYQDCHKSTVHYRQGMQE